MEDAKAFIEWLRDNGATISTKIAIKDYSDEGAGLGVVAWEDIKKDEILFKIPRPCLLTKSSTQHRLEVKKICKGVTGWIPLMWAIILEKLEGEESFWFPYFNILPKEPVPLPTTWTQEEQQRLLASTEIEPFVADGSIQFKKHFLPFKAHFPQTANLSDLDFERLFHLAGSLVSAYSFSEQADEASAPAMVPLADTLNHRTGFNNARLYYERDALVMIAFQDCQAGDQLYNTYGDLGNRELLLRYGFVDEPNPFHRVTFDLEWLAEFISAESTETILAHSEAKLFELLERYEETLGCEFNTGENWKNLLSWCHLLLLPLDTPKKQIKPLKDTSVFLQSHKALIKSILEARLALYPKTSVSADSLPFGPERYVSIIKAQDQKILQTLLESLEQ